MLRRNIIFTFFPLTYLIRLARSEATSDCRVVRSAAKYRRRRCRSSGANIGVTAWKRAAVT